MPVRKPRNPIIEAAREATTDEDKAALFLEEQRWGNEPGCPRCGDTDVYRMMSKDGTKREAHYRWRCRGCKRQYSVRVGTVMVDSAVPLRTWVYAMWLQASSKKGFAAKQLERNCGISYKSALFLAHRVRLAMADTSAEAMLGTVEVDECYIGGKPRPIGRQERERLTAEGKEVPKSKRGRGTLKRPVVVLVERGRGRAIASHVATVTGDVLKGAIRQHVHRSSRIVTDELREYHGIGKDFAGGHHTTHHKSGEYARRNEAGESIHSNGAESFFAIFKRGINGVYHSVSPRHLHRYCDEFAFRWTTRRVDDGERLSIAIRRMEGRRLKARNSTPI